MMQIVGMWFKMEGMKGWGSQFYDFYSFSLEKFCILHKNSLPNIISNLEQRGTIKLCKYFKIRNFAKGIIGTLNGFSDLEKTCRTLHQEKIITKLFLEYVQSTK